MRASWLGGLALVAGLAFPASGGAAGGTYGVVECGSLNREAIDAVQRDSPEYAVKDYCDDAVNGNSFAITNRLLAVDGKRGLVRFPTGSDQLGIVGVSVDAKLRGDDGSHPRLWLADRHLDEVAHFASSDSSGTGYQHYTWSTTHPGAFQFVASLGCERDTCGQTDQAKVLIRNVKLTVADYADPVVVPQDTGLLGGGWLRGSVRLSAIVVDDGSGVVDATASADSVQFADESGGCATIPGTNLAPRIVPCVTPPVIEQQPQTSLPPFRDGSVSLNLCASDFARNVACV